MFKVGVFLRSDGDSLAVYETSNKTTRRVDICREGTKFHIDPFNILYSYYRKGKTEYIFGDRDVYKDYKRIQNEMYIMNLKNNIETKWEDGKFLIINTCGEDDNCFYRTTQVNGVITDEEFSYQGNAIRLHTEQDSAFIDLAPVNLSSYDKLEITGAELKHDTDAVCYPLSELRKRYNISHLEDNEYRYIETVEDGRKALKEIMEFKDNLIGIDTEATGLDFDLFGKDVMTGIIISTKINPDKSFYFPFRQELTPNLPIEFLQEVIDVIQKVQDRACAHRKQFDKKVFLKEGYDINIKYDSYIVSVLNDPRQLRGLHALKTMEEKRSGKKYLELSEMFVNPREIKFEKISDKRLIELYACPDSSNAVKNYYAELKKLPNRTMFILGIEEEIANILAKQEYWGFRIDMNIIKKGEENTDYCINLLEKLIKGMFRKTVKLTSGDALGVVLYNEMHCPVLARTKTGKPSTGSATLTKLARLKKQNITEIVKEDIRDKYNNVLVKKEALNESRYPVLVLLGVYKELVKLKTAFYNRIINKSVSADTYSNSLCYRYFCWINGNGAQSGRQSSPMHQLPKSIKEGVQSDSEDHLLYDTDYAQVELRLIASLAPEPEFVEMCKDPNVDIHRAISSLIAGMEVWQISKEMRQSGKRRNFGVVYDISGHGLAVQECGPGPTQEQVEIQKKNIDEFFNRFKRIKAYMNNNKAIAKKYGKIETYFGRTRYFPELLNPDTPKSKIQSYLRQANNLPVQGTGADILKIAMCKLDKAIIAKGWDKLVDTPQGKYPLVRIMLSIHDELMVSGHKSIPPEEIMEVIRDAMEISIENFAPLFAETSIAPNWLIGHGDSMKVCRGLREELIEEYHKTGKSAFTNTDCGEIYKQIKVKIDAYADNTLIKYLEGILNEHGCSADVLAKYVRHPSLTHEFIERFPQTKEHIKEHGKITDQLERIKYSAERYMEYRTSDEFKGPFYINSTTTVDTMEKEDDSEILQDIEVFLDETSQLVEIDKDGNPVYEEGEEEEEVCDDAYWLEIEERDNAIREQNKLMKKELKYAWKLFDTIVLDLTTLSEKQAVSALNEIYDKYADDNGFYKVTGMYKNENIIDLKFCTEKPDIQDIHNIIERCKTNG